MSSPDDSPARRLRRDLQDRLALWRRLESALSEAGGSTEEPTGQALLASLPVPRMDRALRAFRHYRREVDERLVTISLGGPQDAPFNTTTSISVPDLKVQPFAEEGALWRDPAAWSGKVLEGRYKVLDLIARGGTSLIFLGLDQDGDRSVALKIIPPALRTVVTESRSLTRALRHPAVLEVLETGPAGQGGIFQVLPLIEGLPLECLLGWGAGRAPLPALLLAFRRACEGVAHAHERGILHRDLKPSNIHVREDAGALVADWDLACSAVAGSSGSKLRLGTPLYMAPEQFRGEPLGTQADIYALGLILYQILTGVHPAWKAHDLPRIAHFAEHETPPPPTLLNPAAPKALSKATLRCLRKDPAERFATAAELLEAMEGEGV